MLQSRQKKGRGNEPRALMRHKATQGGYWVGLVVADEAGAVLVLGEAVVDDGDDAAGVVVTAVMVIIAGLASPLAAGDFGSGSARVPGPSR